MHDQVSYNDGMSCAPSHTLYRYIVLCLLGVVCIGSARAVQAETGLPLPRFVSLKSDEVNMRTGPGVRYPVRWIYHHAQLPVEIIDEFEHWRKIRDIDGEAGWVHQSLLSGKRTAYIKENLMVLYGAPSHNANALVKAEAGVVADVIECSPHWCRLQIANIKGWAPKKHFWGAYEAEIFD